MTTTTTARTTPLPPVECAPWCEDGTGHPSARFAEDQWCHSIDGQVPLGGSARLAVYAAQDPGEPPFVCLVDPDERSTNLTPHEARELAARLTHYAWVAEQGHHRPCA